MHFFLNNNFSQSKCKKNQNYLSGSNETQPGDRRRVNFFFQGTFVFRGKLITIFDREWEKNEIKYTFKLYDWSNKIQFNRNSIPLNVVH